jgi:hypothetical protein
VLRETQGLNTGGYIVELIAAFFEQRRVAEVLIDASGNGYLRSGAIMREIMRLMDMDMDTIVQHQEIEMNLR